jgi:hypothetical protein
MPVSSATARFEPAFGGRPRSSAPDWVSFQLGTKLRICLGGLQVGFSLPDLREASLTRLEVRERQPLHVFV